jgi:hypothetical protein
MGSKKRRLRFCGVSVVVLRVLKVLRVFHRQKRIIFQMFAQNKDEGYGVKGRRLWGKRTKVMGWYKLFELLVFIERTRDRE